MADDDAPTSLGVAAVAAACGYSVQQVRDLERLGVLAPAVRAGNGYRRFTAVHVRDLQCYRDLATAVGPVRARHVIRTIRSLPPDAAAALVATCHRTLDRERAEAHAAREVLLAIQRETATEADGVPGDSMSITELSRALAGRPSTLRFWEPEGLVRPERVVTRAGTARRYHLAAIREARVVAALRGAGYRIPDVREALVAIRVRDDVAGSLAALDLRLSALTRSTLALFRASATLALIIEPRSEPPAHHEA